MAVLPDLTIRQFEYLVAIDDAATWSIAAERVGVSPSALSQGIAELERRLGIELFARDGRRRVLRESARPVLDHARQVLGLTADLARWADDMRSARLGRVRVGMIDAAAIVHFPDVIRRFRADHPDVDVRLTVAPSGELLDQLVGGEIDVAVVVQPPRPNSAIDVVELREEDLVVFAPSSGDGERRPTNWGPWVLFPAGSHTRTLIDDALRAAGVPVEVVAESHQPEVLHEMVVLGLGWTVLPRAQAHDAGNAHANGAIRAVRPIATRRLVVARRSGAVTDPAADVLVEALRSHRDR